MTTTQSQLIQTANGYLLCSDHARKWQEGGNNVSMWPANEQESTAGSGLCSDCVDEYVTTPDANVRVASIAGAIFAEVLAQLEELSDDTRELINTGIDYALAEDLRGSLMAAVEQRFSDWLDDNAIGEQ